MGRLYSEKQKVILWWRQDGLCALCGKRMDTFKDEYHHILRHKDGGETSIDNGVMLCQDCHSRAHNNGRYKDSFSLNYNEFKYANFSKSGTSIYNEKLQSFKYKLDKYKDISFETKLFDLKKETTQNLYSVMNEFKSIRLSKTDKNDLFNKFNEIKNNINEKFHKKMKDNYDKSYNLTCEAQNIARSIELKKGVETLKRIQNDAKKYMLNKKDRDEIFKRFQEAWEILNKRKKIEQDKYLKETKENFDHCMSKLRTVENNINQYADFKKLREDLKYVQSYMKDKKYKKEDRDLLFKTTNNLFDKIYKIQQNKQCEYERECENNKIYTLDILNGFYVTEDSDFKAKREILKQAQSYMKGKKYKKEDRNYIFKKIQNYFDDVFRVQNKVRERKQKAWEEKQRQYKRKQDEWEQKQIEWKKRLKENIQRTKESIAKSEQFLYTLEGKLSDKRYKLSSVSDKWKNDFMDQMYTLENKISNVKDQIYTKTQKLYDMQSKL